MQSDSVPLLSTAPNLLSSITRITSRAPQQHSSRIRLVKAEDEGDPRCIHPIRRADTNRQSSTPVVKSPRTKNRRRLTLNVYSSTGPSSPSPRRHLGPPRFEPRSHGRPCLQTSSAMCTWATCSQRTSGRHPRDKRVSSPGWTRAWKPSRSTRCVHRG